LASEGRQKFAKLVLVQQRKTQKGLQVGATLALREEKTRAQQEFEQKDQLSTLRRQEGLAEGQKTHMYFVEPWYFWEGCSVPVQDLALT